MATPAVEGGPGGGGGVAAAPRAGQQQQQQGGFAQSLTGIIRIAVFWYFASKFFAPKKPSDPAILMSNLFQKGEPLDMWVYLSEHERFDDFGNEGALVWHENGIPYAVWGQESARSLSFKYYPSEALKQNGSLYAHVFFARSGYTPDPNDPEFQPLATFGRTHPIVVYFPKSKADKRRSLLGNAEGSNTGEILKEVVDDNQDDLKDDGPVEWVSYWKPNVTINLVDDFTRCSIRNGLDTLLWEDFWVGGDAIVPLFTPHHLLNMKQQTMVPFLMFWGSCCFFCFGLSLPSRIKGVKLPLCSGILVFCLLGLLSFCFVLFMFVFSLLVLSFLLSTACFTYRPFVCFALED